MSLVVRETQVKTTRRYHCFPIRGAGTPAGMRTGGSDTAGGRERGHCFGKAQGGSGDKSILLHT